MSNIKSLKNKRYKLDIAMSKYKSLKKNRNNNIKSLKKKEINLTLQCLNLIY